MSYQPYRGPRKARRGKVIIILAFVMLALVAAAVVFFAAQEYIVFTAEGFRFEFPFMSKKPTEPPTEPESTEDVAIIIEDTTAPTEPPTTTPPTEPPFVKPLTAAKIVTAAGFSEYGSELSPALIVKDFDGIYHIPQPDVAVTDEQTQMLDSLAQKGGSAVFSAMRDAVGPRSSRSLAITTTGGVTWLDYDYISWYDPYKGGAHLLDAARVCAEGGISELIFTNLQFPTRGRLEYINFGETDVPEARIKAITALLQPVREYLDEQEAQIYLSVVLTEKAAQQFSDGEAGQDVRELAKLCDILYVPTADAEFDINPLLDAIHGTDCRVGLWLNSQTAPERLIDYVLLK